MPGKEWLGQHGGSGTLEFIRRLFAALLLIVAAVSGQTTGTDIAKIMVVRPLRGLTTCGVSIEDLDEEAIRAGLNERVLQRAVTTQLNGLGVQTPDNWPLDGPQVSVHIPVIKIGSDRYAFSIFMELRALRGDFVTTWRQFSMGAADKNGLPSTVMKTLLLVLNDFKQDYKLANK
jgi:hypothetical protein